MEYLRPLSGINFHSQLAIPTAYDDSLSYYEVLNRTVYGFNDIISEMNANYELIDGVLDEVLAECKEYRDDAEGFATSSYNSAEMSRAYADLAEEQLEGAEAAKTAAEAAKTAAEEAKVKAEEFADAAMDAVESAESFADQAEISANSANTAMEAAETAQELAEAAQELAEAAQSGAEAAEAEAEAFATAAENAKEAAEQAKVEAESFKSGAELAQSKSETAQASAELAQSRAETAASASELAQSKAEQAKTAAETAQSKAEEAKIGAEAAKTAAETAAGQADAFSTDAESAARRAETAQLIAEEAKESALEAAGQATEYAASAGEYASTAETAKNDAVTAKEATEAAKTEAVAAKDAAELAKLDAEQAKNDAKIAEASALVAKQNAMTASAEALGYKREAETAAETATEQADLSKTQANLAKQYAEAASGSKTAAESAADRAEAAAEEVENNYLPLTGGTLTGNLSLGNNQLGMDTGHIAAGSGTLLFEGYTELDADTAKISNVGAPTEADDAATKSYVDNAISGIPQGDFLPLSGGTLTGTLNAQDIILGGANNYIGFGTPVNAAINVTNGNLTFTAENISMKEHKIIEVGEPTEADDAATKGYVDTAVDNYLPLTGGTLTGDLTAENITLGADNELAFGTAASIDATGNNLTLNATGSIDVSTKKIINLATPTASTDAATKAYVDNAVSDLPTGDYLPLSGGTLTGTLNTKNVYVDANSVLHFGSSEYIRTSGGNLTFATSGLINMTDSRIVNVLEPQNANDVATKTYVDNKGDMHCYFTLDPTSETVNPALNVLRYNFYMKFYKSVASDNAIPPIKLLIYAYDNPSARKYKTTSMTIYEESAQAAGSVSNLSTYVYFDMSSILNSLLPSDLYPSGNYYIAGASPISLLNYSTAVHTEGMNTFFRVRRDQYSEAYLQFRGRYYNTSSSAPVAIQLYLQSGMMPVFNGYLVSERFQTTDY